MDLSGFPARLLVSSAMLLTSVALRADGEANFTDETRPLLSGGSQPSVASIPFLFVTRCIALIQIGLVLAETCALPLLNTSFGISKMTSCLIELLAWIVMLRMCSAWPNQLRLERPFTQLTTRLPLFGFLATSTSLLHLDVVGFKISESALCTIFLAVRTLSSAFSLSLAFLALFQSSSISAEAIEYAESMVKESGGMLPCPEPNQVNFSNAVSVISFGWMNSLMRLGGKRPIEMKDLPELGTESKAENASERFRKNRTRFKYLFTALVVTEAKSFIFQASFAVLAIVSGLSLPYFLYKITGFIERPGSEQEYMGYIYAALFVLCAFVKRLCDTHAWHISRNVGVRIKAMLVNEIYCKSLKIIPGGKSNSAPSASSGVTEDASSGKIVTLMSTDAEQVRDRIPELCDISVMPFQIIAAIVGLLYVIGWSALAGLLVMCLTFIATFYNSKWSVRVYQRLLSAQDDRTSIVNEVLQGIRIVKYFAWEERFLAKIDMARQREMRSLVHLYITDVLGNLIFLAAPLAVSFTTLLVLTKYAGVELNSQMAFTCLSLFNNLRYPLMYLPGMVSNVFKLKVALGRISDFLNQSELEQYPVRPIGQDEGVLGFKNATLAWILSGEGENGGFQLRNLDLSFPTGAVSIISGATGSGKSSLIHGILGEMKLLSGTAFLPARNEVDSFAYVPQTAWLMNASLRENILFGQPMDISRYNSVLQACALLKDLDLLEARDMTEIGEKGINLSGGQKQRISIARALYSSAKTVLLDDPLSAVDAPTARHLFQQAICGPLMAGRTVILVTHAVSLVLKSTKVKYLAVMNAGRVAAAGPVSEVLETEQARNMIGLSSAINDMDEDVLEPEIVARKETVVIDEALRNPAVKLVEDETKVSGALGLKFYYLYFSHAGFGYVGIACALFTLDRVVKFFNDYWIKLWADSYNKGSSPPLGFNFWQISGTLPSDVDYYISMYGFIGLFWLLVVLAADFMRCVGAYKAAQVFHDVLIRRIIFSPMRFFDKTPIGRVLNRMTKDCSIIDYSVMANFKDLIVTFAEALSIMVVVFAIVPMFTLIAIPLLAIYYFAAKRFLACQREMKRLDSISRSPIYSMFSETLSGASTIRAYAAEPRFIAENLRRTDRNHAAYVYMYGANRWFSSRIALIAGIVILVAALGAVRMRDSLGAGMAGLTLTWVMSFADYLNWIVRVHSNLEMSMNAVERVDEYSEIPQEAAAVVESNPPPSNWPSKGALTVCNLEMRYASDLPPVLQNVSFALNGGEKLGIVGRTGAGKSSLSLALFRIVEASKGAIHIDGLDISKMGLHDLRSRMTIIPQDPVLFEGTVRNNLDPFGQYDDTAIWSSLHDVKFMDSLQSHKFVAPLQLSHRSSDLTLNANEVEWSGFGLDSPVAEGGTNFSQGQRQLLCLTRALLKSSTVTVLDEATASIDSETDANIQQVIRGPSFANTTVLSIAHRLRTVIDYDKILVLDKGCVVQFGPPAELIRVNGVFRTMCMETGEFEELCILAGK